MEIKLSDHFTLTKLLKFTSSPMIMMFFCSIYSVVDGIMVSNAVGKNALAAINIIWPLVMIIGSFGFMLGTGGSAVIARTLGEGKNEQAKSYFTFIIISIIVIAFILSSIVYCNLESICYLFGANEVLIDECLKYGKILIGAEFLFMLQNSFQTLTATAEKPKIGLYCTIGSGIANIVFDYLFIYIFNFGIAGAALGTTCGYAIGAIVPLIYFMRKNSSLLNFTKTSLYLNVLFESCINGLSEMLSNISSSIIVTLYNIKLMAIIGEIGISAYSILCYVDFLFKGVLFGFTMGVSPIIGYNYGSKNEEELKNVVRMSIKTICLISLVMFILAQGSSTIITSIYVKNDIQLYELAKKSLMIYSYGYLFSGVNILTSGIFTSLCNGGLSGFISFTRSLIFPLIFVDILADIFNTNGIWMSGPISELMAAIICVVILLVNKKKYKY